MEQPGQDLDEQDLAHHSHGIDDAVSGGDAGRRGFSGDGLPGGRQARRGGEGAGHHAHSQRRVHVGQQDDGAAGHGAHRRHSDAEEDIGPAVGPQLAEKRRPGAETHGGDEQQQAQCLDGGGDGDAEVPEQQPRQKDARRAQADPLDVDPADQIAGDRDQKDRQHFPGRLTQNEHGPASSVPPGCHISKIPYFRKHHKDLT